MGNYTGKDDASEAARIPFFDLLTWDLRYYIYQLAFSGRVLHVYLLYRRGLQADSRWRKGHAPIPEWFPNSPSVSVVDSPFANGEISPQWYWWSCVCGLDDVRKRPRADGIASLDRQIALQDACPKGFFQASDTREAALGVSGWLRSCRRAYEETIRLLYATNTFKLDQRLEAFYFPYCLPQSHLGWITSFDVRVHDRDDSLLDPSLSHAPSPGTNSPALSHLRASSSRQHYKLMIAGLNAACPALRRLHVTFEGSVRRVPVPRPDGTSLMITTIGEVTSDELEVALLGPLDALPAAVDRQILFYRSVYMALRARAVETGDIVEEEGEGWRRLWRPLDDSRSDKGGYWVLEKG